MLTGSQSHVQAEIPDPQLQGQIHYTGPQWAEFDVSSQALRALKSAHTQLTEYGAKVWKLLVPCRNSPLEDLPTEIIIEIFKYVGWKGVLSSRQTCKRLFDVSTARPLWVLFFNRLSTELMVPPVLERPLSASTAEEIENVVLTRISSEAAWMAGTAPKTRSGPQPFDARADCPILLDGGRWFLWVSTGYEQPYGIGRVYAYDLEKPLSQEPQCIIDLGIGPDERQIWVMDASVDHSDPTLSFNLCVVPFCFENRRDPMRPRRYPPVDVHVYRLTLKGRGSEATLEAQKIKTLHNGLQAMTSMFIIGGHYFARSLNYRDPLSEFFGLEVCNWLLSDDSFHSKAYICGVPHSVTFLPHGILLVTYSSTIALYNVANLHPVRAGDAVDTELTLRPYWSQGGLQLHYGVKLSKPYTDPHLHTTRVAIAFAEAVHGLIIPHNRDSDPWFEPIFNFADRVSGTLFGLGIDKMIFLEWSGRGRTVNYVWPAEAGDATASEYGAALQLEPPGAQLATWTVPCRGRACSLFDERSNRFFWFIGGVCVLMDFTSN